MSLTTLQIFSSVAQLSPLTLNLTNYVNQEHNIDAIGAEVQQYTPFPDGGAPYYSAEPHYWIKYTVEDSNHEKYNGWLRCQFSIINNEVLEFTPLDGSIRKEEINHLIPKAIVYNREPATSSKIYDVRLNQWQIDVIKMSLETFNDPARDGCLPVLPQDNPNIDDSPESAFEALKDMFAGEIQESPCINAFVL